MFTGGNKVKKSAKDFKNPAMNIKKNWNSFLNLFIKINIIQSFNLMIFIFLNLCANFC